MGGFLVSKLLPTNILQFLPFNSHSGLTTGHNLLAVSRGGHPEPSFHGICGLNRSIGKGPCKLHGSLQEKLSYSGGGRLSPIRHSSCECQCGHCACCASNQHRHNAYIMHNGAPRDHAQLVRAPGSFAAWPGLCTRMAAISARGGAPAPALMG